VRPSLLHSSPPLPRREGPMDSDQFFDFDWLPPLDLSSDQWASLNIDLGPEAFVDIDLPLPVDQGLRTSSPIAFLGPLTPCRAIDIFPSQPYAAAEPLQPLPDRCELSPSEESSRTLLGPCTAETTSADHIICPLPRGTKDRARDLQQEHSGANFRSSHPVTTGGMFITFSLDNRPVKASTRRRISERRRGEIAEMRLIGSCVLCRRDKRLVRTSEIFWKVI
jgi:hypothetical protein